MNALVSKFDESQLLSFRRSDVIYTSTPFSGEILFLRKSYDALIISRFRCGLQVLENFPWTSIDRRSSSGVREHAIPHSIDSELFKSAVEIRFRVLAVMVNQSEIQCRSSRKRQILQL